MNRDSNDLFDRPSEAQAFKSQNRDLNGEVVMIIDFAIVFSICYCRRFSVFCSGDTRFFRFPCRTMESQKKFN